MKKIDWYIIGKFLGTFFYAISLIVVVVIIFDISEKIDDFIEGQAPFKLIVTEYYLNFIPFFVNLFSPLFTFIAVIYFTSKMASNSEIVAILSSGMSFTRMLLPYIIGAIVITILSLVLNNFVIPDANKKRLAFEETYIRSRFHNVDRNIHKQLDPTTFVYFERYENTRNIGYKFSIENIENWRDSIFNDFEDFVFSSFPEIGKIKSALYNSGAIYASLSGSGSSVYGIFTRVTDLKAQFENHTVWNIPL